MLILELTFWITGAAPGRLLLVCGMQVWLLLGVMCSTRGDYSAQLSSELFDGGVIRRMDVNRIPFETESFDFMVNNQVMEHVPDLDGVLNEILRVLKPGGTVLSLFPDGGVRREGH